MYVPARIARMLVVVGGLALGLDAHAQTAEAPGGEVEAPVEEVLVTGEQPGPGLWQVRRADDSDGHVLWILGSYAPLPKDMKWRSKELDGVIAASQELIAPPSVDAKVGALGGITLLPTLIGVRNNPDGRRLSDVVPPDLYARWLPLKERYLARNNDVERWRPIFAAQKLYFAALRESGLEPYGVVWPVVEKRARKARLPITEPKVKVKLEKPREAIREFKQAPLSDLECFAKTIERLESDVDLMRVRANAWATGDVATLRRLAPVDQASACIAVVMNSSLVQERGLADLPERFTEAWLEAADEALARNPSTLAVLSLERILAADGFLARLKARGYVVQDP
jgi:uncharacterized protein YbaP (TraB family)